MRNFARDNLFFLEFLDCSSFFESYTASAICRRSTGGARARRYHRRQTQLHRKARQGTDRHLAKSVPPVMHRRNVKISSAPQRFFTQKLRDKRRLWFNVETIRGARKIGHPPVGRRTAGAERSGQEAQRCCPKSAELPTWVEFRQEKIEDLLVEERISDLRGCIETRSPLPWSGCFQPG